MFKTIRDAFKVKEIRNGLIFTFFILIVVRLGSLIPTPGVDTSKLSNYIANNLGDGANSLLAIINGKPIDVIRNKEYDKKELIDLWNYVLDNTKEKDILNSALLRIAGEPVNE